ncbi:hypothetical protein RJ641_002903 [Dillenia turbinata]|uniref:RRM domain-containing protein n=1 Tax=Dillenia turbinata TaxID=194707 RepID=A0AAN8ZDR0_9MAGN
MLSLGISGSNGFCLSASKNRKDGNISVLETSGIDDEFGEDYEDDDDDDDDVLVPLRNMKTWLENKPRGFGEGKVYDTTIEDKLLDEIQQSRVVQLANINKLKNNPLKPSNEIDQQKEKKERLHSDLDIFNGRFAAPEIIPTGIRVCLANLPKKKNIHRDLKLAFDGIPGIVNIIPAVLGNKKTRDPVCKGFAFIDFKSEEDANR